MRTNLITHLHCSNCGRVLNVEYDKEDSPRKIEAMESDEPTGAACRHNRILVEPCRYCIEAATGPAKQLASAIKAISGT